MPVGKVGKFLGDNDTPPFVFEGPSKSKCLPPTEEVRRPTGPTTITDAP